MTPASHTSTSGGKRRSRWSRSGATDRRPGLVEARWTDDARPAEPYDEPPPCTSCHDDDGLRLSPGVVVALCLYLTACIGLVLVMAFAIGRVYGLNP